jgi:sortase A
MRIISLRSRLRARTKALSWWIERGFLTVGLVALGLWCAVSLNTYVFQQRGKANLAQVLSSSHKPPEKLRSPIKDGDFIGEIDIPKLDLSAIILEGSDERSLRLGVGHIQGTALPGDLGNVSLAAHRDTFFRPLRKIRKNDEIHLITFDNSYRYRVDWARVVRSNNVNVLKPSQEPTLTLITCFPFYFVGSAPERFVVRAHKEPMQETHEDQHSQVAVSGAVKSGALRRSQD